MGNTRVLSEIGSLMWSHPYVSCSLLVFLTPPFFPVLKFFSPLLISTALFVVALVTMGPHFEEPSNQEDDFLINASEFKTKEEVVSRRDDGERDVKTKKPNKDVCSTWTDWVKSWKESGISWMEKKLQNKNWKGGSLNDDNVSILQEAFAHQAEEKTQVMTKLVTRRIPDEEEGVEETGLQEQAGIILTLSHSDSWTSDRSFERPPSFSTGMSNIRDLSHNFFSPHPSFCRRQDSDVNPLFENVIPPPIDYDMPPLITGPASITAPLFKSLEEDDMDMSDDEYDHHHYDHEHLEVGESTVDANSIIPHDERLVVNETHHQPVENLASPKDEGHSASQEILHQENGATESSLLSTHVDTVNTCDIDVTGTHKDSALPANDAPEGHLPLAEERSIPAIEVHHKSHPAQGETSQPNEELHNIPELEDVLPMENESREIDSAEGVVAALPDEVHGIPATSEALTHHSSEVLSAPVDASMDLASHVVERSMSLPVHGSLIDQGSHKFASTHEDLPPLDTLLLKEAHHSFGNLNHAISLPAALHPIQPILLPPKTTDHGPLSPNIDLGIATTFDHGNGALVASYNSAERYNSIALVSEDEVACKQLSTKDKILNMEALCNSLLFTAAVDDSTKPACPLEVNKALQATTEEHVSHVAEKMTSLVEDNPSKKFQPDAPQLQITPPSTKVVLAPSHIKFPVGAGSPALARALIRPPPPPSKSFTSRYSSSEDESGDEEIDLDSDVDVVGEDSDSDLDLSPSVKSGTKLKAPPKPPVDQIRPAQTAVHG